MHLNQPTTIIEAGAQIISEGVEEVTEEAHKQMMDYFLIELENSDYAKECNILIFKSN